MERNLYPYIRFIPRGTGTCSTLPVKICIRKKPNRLVSTRKDLLALCAQSFTPFEQVIPLQIDTLLPGTRIVIVDGVQGSFELPGAGLLANFPGS